METLQNKPLQQIVDESIHAVVDDSINAVDNPWATAKVFENDGAYANDDNE